MRIFIIIYAIGLLVGLPFVYLDNKFIDPTGNFYLINGIFLFGCINLIIIILGSAILNFHDRTQKGFLISVPSWLFGGAFSTAAVLTGYLIRYKYG